MSATILAFPAPARRQAALSIAPIDTALAEKFTEHFLPVVQASVDLLEADEPEFEGRCRGMLDADGTVMIDDICAEMLIASRQMQTLVDGLDLTRARLRTAMARLQQNSGDECKMKKTNFVPDRDKLLPDKEFVVTPIASLATAPTFDREGDDQ